MVQHPLVGVGYGNDTFLKLHAAEVEAEKGKGPEERVLPALHNTFAMVLMGSGVPAIILFIWIFVSHCFNADETVAAVHGCRNAMVTCGSRSCHCRIRHAEPVRLHVCGESRASLLDSGGRRIVFGEASDLD